QFGDGTLAGPMPVTLEAFFRGFFLRGGRKLLHAQKRLRLLQQSERVAVFIDQPVNRSGVLRIEDFQNRGRPCKVDGNRTCLLEGRSRTRYGRIGRIRRAEASGRGRALLERGRERLRALKGFPGDDCLDAARSEKALHKARARSVAAWL